MRALLLPLSATSGVNGTALTVLIVLFLLVTVAGFLATRFKRAESLDSLEEWGLGGRKFGTVVTWFLLGGDLYTAYTFVAVPAAMFATGAVAGFFAVPYTIILYPIVFVFMARLWSVSHRHGYITTSDFIRGRYDSRPLSLAVAVTGFLATMPYIALQLVGIQAVLTVAGLGGSGSWLTKDLPLLIAFAVLAAYTYTSGLRAPAVIAFVKDILIYLVIIVAVIYLPHHVGGWSHVFSAAKAKMDATSATTGKPTGTFMSVSTTHWAYATLALGSAMALFMYPHSVTASLSSKSRNTIRRNAAILPAYSFLLGLLALLGWVAIAYGIDLKKDLGGNAQLVIPQLFESAFPAWFAGVAFAAIAIGALVPAAIMSIAAANTFSRNIYKEWLKPDATPQQEAKVSKIMSLVVKAFALVFVLTMDKQNAINFQLLGGIWILQIFPAVVFSLYTRWFHRWALLAGWAVAMVYGTVEAYKVISPTTGGHFGGSLALIPGIGQMGYIAMTAFVLNVAVAVVLTLVLNAVKVSNGADATSPGDYHADAGDPRVDADVRSHAAAQDPFADPEALA
ncbi:MAG: sodium:solute symporter family protein [Nocardioidaceae bacterium]|nr:sodium:solute symporter family protein [Nocardioidaceae bacterium]MCL2614182.1 sodium:solute symporter family protein [Nocardioidaceae bacterium]